MTAQTASQLEETEATTNDVEEILQTPKALEVNGIKVEVRRLKTREFFSLMRILVQGAGGNLVRVFAEEDPNVMAGQLAGMLIGAIPNAEFEFMRFLNMMVEPVDEKDAEKLKSYLENPEIDDLLVIAQTIVESEAGEFAKLGKAARSWWETQGKAALGGTKNR